VCSVSSRHDLWRGYIARCIGYSHNVPNLLDTAFPVRSTFIFTRWVLRCCRFPAMRCLRNYEQLCRLVEHRIQCITCLRSVGSGLPVGNVTPVGVALSQSGFVHNLTGVEVKVLVVGATGRIGVLIVKRLVEDGYDVRSMCISKREGRCLEGIDTEVVLGDVTDDDSVRNTVKGCDVAVVSLAAPRESDGDRIEHRGTVRVLNALREAGGKHFIYISGAAVETMQRFFPRAAAKLRAETAIKLSNVPYTILRCTWVNESMRSFILGSRAFVIGRQPNKFHWVAAADIARMVAGAIVAREAQNTTLTVFGPEPLTVREALVRYLSIARPHVRIKTVPMGLTRMLTMLSPGIRSDAIVFMRFFEKHVEVGDPLGANRILGAPSITIEKWARTEREQDAGGIV
jgi:uncharacterized protein YbjT (DUF2867 family)